MTQTISRLESWVRMMRYVGMADESGRIDGYPERSSARIVNPPTLDACQGKTYGFSISKLPTDP